MLECCSLDVFFSKQLQELNCGGPTKAYIVSTLQNFKNNFIGDYSKDSLTVKYAEARFNRDFYKFQNIGDWLLYSKSFFPESLNNASENYYISLAQLSYYSCYKMINSWYIYQELADRFIPLTEQIRELIFHNL